MYYLGQGRDNFDSLQYLFYLIAYISQFIKCTEYTQCLLLLKGPAADAMDAPQPRRLIVQLNEEDDDEVLYAFRF